MDTAQPSKHIQTVKLEGGAKVIGPYSAGMIVSPQASMIYLRGAIGVDSKTQELISDDVVDQTRQCFVIIEERLRLAKSGLHNVVKCVVYLTGNSCLG